MEKPSQAPESRILRLTAVEIWIDNQLAYLWV